MSSIVPCLALAALAAASAIPAQPPASHLRLTIRAHTASHNLAFDCTGIHCRLTIDLRLTGNKETSSAAVRTRRVVYREEGTA